MQPLVRRLSRALASAAALTLLVTPAAAVAAPDPEGTAHGGSSTTVASDILPLETSTPTIEGTLRVGSRVRALAGSWTPGTTFTYSWYAGTEVISGATESTFTVTAAQRGKRLIVRLEGFREGYIPAGRNSEATSRIDEGYISQGLPVIVGNATPGGKLIVFRPRSVPSGVSVSYRWRLDGEPIRGANRSELTVRPAWRGHVITVTATVDQAGYVHERATSAGARVGGVYAVSPRPVVSGTQRVGSTLTAVRGTWSPMPSSFSFRWYADGRPISGATTSRYTLRGSDYKKKITVTARSYRAGWGTVLRRSAATSEVLASATRWVDAGSFVPVGPGGVAPTTYIAQPGRARCLWERYVTPDLTTDPAGISSGSGQRVFEVLDTDALVATNEACGAWIKYYPRMVRTSDATATHGVYVLGDHLERGVYSTSGPAVGEPSCRYTFYKGFYGYYAEIGGGRVGATTITMPDSAVGFETRGCSWKRIS